MFPALCGLSGSKIFLFLPELGTRNPPAPPRWPQGLARCRSLPPSPAAGLASAPTRLLPQHLQLLFKPVAKLCKLFSCLPRCVLHSSARAAVLFPSPCSGTTRAFCRDPPKSCSHFIHWPGFGLYRSVRTRDVSGPVPQDRACEQPRCWCCVWVQWEHPTSPTPSHPAPLLFAPSDHTGIKDLAWRGWPRLVFLI